MLLQRQDFDEITRKFISYHIMIIMCFRLEELKNWRFETMLEKEQRIQEYYQYNELN